MLIRMLVGLSGSAFSLGPGDERDFPKDEAIRLIEAGFADPVRNASEPPAVAPETAVRKPAAERRTRKTA